MRLSSSMMEVPAIRERLVQSTESTRAAMRCLGGARDSQETSQKALSLLCDLLDLLYRIKDQLNWAEEKWILDTPRLNALNELLVWFDSALISIQLYFQSGGVGVRAFRKHLLERTVIPKLEQYKTVFILSMQPDSEERSSVNRDIRTSLRTYYDVDSASLKLNLCHDTNILGVTDRLCSDDFITLADLCNRRQKGTCQWIFKNDKYKQWLAGTARTLYCLGRPGAGKTFLSSIVIDSLQRTFTTPDVAVVFVLCHNEREGGQTSTRLLQNILAQLVYLKRSPSFATASLYHLESSHPGRVSPKAYQNAIRVEVNRFSKVFFVIDGLDVFPEKDRILNRLHKLPEHAQLMITLRERKHLDKISYLTVSAPDVDIHSYVLSRIHQDAGLSNLVQDDSASSNLQEDILRCVAEKCRGLFLLAKLQMDILTRYSERAIVQRALVHLPETLEDSYAEAMKQVARRGPHASAYIYWTLYSCRPLTVAELRLATRKESKNGEVGSGLSSPEHTILDDSAGLLAIDAATGTVNFYHKTARDYISRMAARVFFPTAQKEIAETCLTAISSDEVVDECYLSHGGSPRSPRSGLLNYAATYWGYHVRRSEDDETIQVLTKAFLNKLSWRRPPMKSNCIIEYGFPMELGLGRYPDDWNILHTLAYFGILGKTKGLLKQGVDVNVHDNLRRLTPLHCAAYRGNEEMVELLLDNGADINAKTKNGDTALHLASEQGHRKILKLLFSRKADFEITNRKGASALHAAVGTENDETTVPLLVKNKIDVNCRNPITKNNVLHLAVEWSRPRILLFLLDKGTNIDTTNKQGLTPLHLATKKDNCEALSLLLDRGANVEARTESGLTALHLAANEKNWVAFDLLLIGGADINVWNNRGESLLHEHARRPFDISVAAKLLDQGANIEARTSHGYTPLQCAAMSRNKKMFVFLMNRGAKIDVQTPKGETLLHITPPYNQDCLDILQMLLNKGLSVKAISSEGWAPLQQTVFMGTGSPDIALDKTPDYIHLLLSQGVDINASSATPNGETPLHLATMATICRPSLVSLLVKLGAFINARTKDGKTPLHLAAERGRESVFRVLLESGADKTARMTTTPVAGDGHGPVGENVDGGPTPIDLARKNPLGALWLDEEGNLRPLPVKGRRGSIATTIETCGSELDTETGESTLVGSSVW